MKEPNFSFEISDLSHLDALNEQVENGDLNNIIVSINLDENNWEKVDDLLINHKNTIELNLWFHDKEFFSQKPTWSNLDFLKDLKGLKNLTVYDPYITDISPIFDCSNLIELTFMEINKATKLSVEGISKLSKLESLVIRNQVKEFSEINNLENLKYLESWNQKKDFRIDNLKYLTGLYLYACTSKFNDKELLHHPNLISFFTWGDFLSEYNHIQELHSLEHISISNNKKITDIKFLNNLNSLKKLELYRVSNISSIPELNNTSVEEVDLSQMKRLVDISNLSKLNSLRKVQLDSLPEIAVNQYYELLRSGVPFSDFRVEIDNPEEWRKITLETKNLGINTYQIE